MLGTIIGWLADGVGAVVNFFSGLFGGAKDSKEEVEGLNGAVNGLQESANTEVIFSNATKTAEKWGVGVKVQISKSTGYDTISSRPVSGSYV